MLNIVLLCTLWVCVWVLGTKERENKAIVRELMLANDKIEEQEDEIRELENEVDELKDTVFDLTEQGGLFNE